MGKRSPAAPMMEYRPAEPAPLRIEVKRLGAHPVTGLPPHGHRFFEMLLVERGRGRHWLSGRETEVGPGDLILVAPGELHDASGLRGVDGWLILFTLDEIVPGRADADLFAMPDELTLLSFLRLPGADQPGALTIPLADRARWRRRIAELADELAAPRIGSAEAARSILKLLLVEATRLVSDRVGAIPAASRPLLVAVFRFIDSRFRSPISLADVARAVGRSPAYLTDLVRRETGRPVLSWIVERRLAEARRLLIETDADVEQIAERVSYADAGFFIRLFRRRHGMTPAAWRRAHDRAASGARRGERAPRRRRARGGTRPARADG